MVKEFRAATNAPISAKVSELPNKRFGKAFEPNTVSVPSKGRSPLSTSHGKIRGGKDDIGKVGTKVPLKSPDFTKGNRPSDWPPGFERP